MAPACVQDKFKPSFFTIIEKNIKQILHYQSKHMYMSNNKNNKPIMTNVFVLLKIII